MKQRWCVVVIQRDPTVVWVLEDRHGHHDRRRRGIKGAGGSGLLQRRDGAAVLRRDVGVWTGTHRSHHTLQGLSYREIGLILAQKHIAVHFDYIFIFYLVTDGKASAWKLHSKI